MPGSSFQNIPPALRGDRTGNQIFSYENAAEIFPLTEYHHAKVIFATLLSRQWFLFFPRNDAAHFGDNAAWLPAGIPTAASPGAEYQLITQHRTHAVKRKSSSQ